MRRTDRIHLAGSGALGFGLTDASDCHVYLVDGGVRHLLLTHAHADHAGGAARLRALPGILRCTPQPDAGTPSKEATRRR